MSEAVETPSQTPPSVAASTVELYVVEASVGGEKRRYVGISKDALQRIHQLRLGNGGSFLREKGALRPGIISIISIRTLVTRKNALIWELVTVAQLHAAGFRVRGACWSNVKLGATRDELKAVARIVANSDDPTEAIADISHMSMPLRLQTVIDNGGGPTRF